MLIITSHAFHHFFSCLFLFINTKIIICYLCLAVVSIQISGSSSLVDVSEKLFSIKHYNFCLFFLSSIFIIISRVFFSYGLLCYQPYYDQKKQNQNTDSFFVHHHHSGVFTPLLLLFDGIFSLPNE